MKNSSYYIAPVGDRTHDLPHTVASNMVKVSHILNHLAMDNYELNRLFKVVKKSQFCINMHHFYMCWWETGCQGTGRQQRAAATQRVGRLRIAERPPEMRVNCEFSHLSHLSWPSPCAGPASIWVIQYFRSCAMSSVSRYFFMSPCMLSLHLFLGRPRLLLPETSSLSDFAQMWLGSRLKQWPNHFSLLFSRKVSTGFTWASFLMSSFLMWSNLVFPLAHLNILISAEYSLLSSFFFTAQHSEPYVIAGLIIVLKTLSFNSTGIFLSHITLWIYWINSRGQQRQES